MKSAETYESWLREVLLELLRTSTEVPVGHTQILPGDPRIVRAVDEEVAPIIEALGPDEVLRHESGDVAARFGPERDDGLLLQTYIVSQHANLMDNPHDARIVDGAEYGLVPGPCAVGQGATQNKGPMASALAAVRARPADLPRPVWLVVNTEGMSSHAGSRRVLDELGVRAASGIVAFGTDLRVSLGNRGRVDVEVTVAGRSSHSSQPWLGTNPIEGAAAVIGALRSIPTVDPHPELGPATVTPFAISCFPVAPHTIPERATISVDRRLLPGGSAEDAVTEIRDHLTRELPDTSLVVEAGESMLPAEVDPHSPVVTSLLEGIERASGGPGETFWSLNAFDAGYACARGIPTPMFGPGKRAFASAGLTGVDLVPLADCEIAAGAIAHAIRRLCG
jgi:succinyl-diaminopimelate desuccinylase